MQKQQKQSLLDENNNTKSQIYIHSFPFRAVLPYSHKYETFAKSRWYGKPLLETLVKQFKAYGESYYKAAVEEGRITINNKQVSIDYVIKNGDKLVHSAIRQQPPILDLEIQIIEDNQEYLVVNKPPSFTVHTGGGFHYNTLMSVLELEKGYRNLFVLHRLDRLTSGLIIFGKTKEKPQIFHKQNQTTQMKKMYFARVSGNVQWNQRTLCAQIQCVSHKDGVYKVTKELLDKEEKFEKSVILQHKQQQKEQKNEDKQQKQVPKKNKKVKQQNNNPDLKQSMTHFRRVFYDKQSDSSLVQCYPISGRTHQIRVHLQFLGHPILNDVIYGGRFVGNNIIDFMPNRLQIKGHHHSQQQQVCDDYGRKRVKKDNQSQQRKKNQHQSSQMNLDRVKQELHKQWDIETRPWQICLHSYQYTLEGRTYRTKRPYWAQQQFRFKK